MYMCVYIFAHMCIEYLWMYWPALENVLFKLSKISFERL